MTELYQPNDLLHDPVAVRRRRVLSIVIQEYTQTAQPVGGATIAKKYALGVSSATIRNDLAALEKEGLLTHPHTSAGRVPTDAGYRYFVQHLLAHPKAELSVQERQDIRGEFGQAREELDQWLRVSTAILARTSHGAALATAPRATRSRFKHLELVGIHDTKVLLVLVLQEGTVRQQLLDLDQPIGQSDLSAISNELNAKLQGLSADEINSLGGLVHQHDDTALLREQVFLLTGEIMGRIDHDGGGQIYRDGLTHILDAPEFSAGESAHKSVHKIVRVFEQHVLLEAILDEYRAVGGVQVVINGEGRFRELEDVSLVLGSYGVSEQATGILGVIGPLRMSYGRSIGAVRFVAALLSEKIEDMYGYQAKL